MPPSSLACHPNKMSHTSVAYCAYSPPKKLYKNVNKAIKEKLHSGLIPWDFSTFHRRQQEKGQWCQICSCQKHFFFLGILPQSVWSHWVSWRHNSLISLRATLKFLGNLDLPLLCPSDYKTIQKKTLFSSSENIPDPPLTNRKAWCSCGGNENTLNSQPCM